MREITITEANIDTIDETDFLIFSDQREWLAPGCVVRNYVYEGRYPVALVIWPDQAASVGISENVKVLNGCSWGQIETQEDGSEIVRIDGAQPIIFRDDKVVFYEDIDKF